MVDSRSVGDVLNGCFDADVGFFVYIELPDPVGKTRGGDELAREVNLSEGVRLRLVPDTDTLGVELADSRHYALQEV